MYKPNNMGTDPIDEKIELLRDFRLLRRTATEQETAVRRILGGCTEIQMDQKLHDILCGNKTLKEFIEQEERCLYV